MAKDFVPRSGDVKNDPDSLERWLDKIPIRLNTDALNVLSAPATNDKLCLFDTSAGLHVGITLANLGLAITAANATALATARTIGGVSFDGTANITVASATGGFAVSGGNFTYQVDQNTATLLTVTNATNGTAAQAGFQAVSDVASLVVEAHATNRVVTRMGIAVGGFIEIQNNNAGNGLMIDTRNATPIYIGTNNTLAITISSSQNVTFAGTITTIGGATFHTTSSALTNGAGAGAGTITNAPSAGNPTKWIGISDNGTVRYIPSW